MKTCIITIAILTTFFFLDSSYTNVDTEEFKQLICIMFKEQQMLLKTINVLAEDDKCNLNTLNIKYDEIILVRDEELLIQILITCDPTP